MGLEIEPLHPQTAPTFIGVKADEGKVVNAFSWVANSFLEGLFGGHAQISVFFKVSLKEQSIAHLHSPVTYIQLNKVNRCLARYSPHATTTNRPTTGH